MTGVPWMHCFRNFRASMASAPDANIPTRSVYLQRGTSAIQLAFGRERLGPPLVAFAANMDIRKIRGDVMPVTHIHAGAHVDGYIGGNIHRDVARTRLQIGVVTLAARIHQFHRDAARPCFRTGRGNPEELNAAAAGLCVYRSLGRRQMNAAASGFDLRRSAHITQIHAAAARRYFYLPAALPHLHIAAAGLDDRALRSCLDLDATSSGFRHDFAVGMPNVDGASASVQTKVAADGADIDRPASGFGTRSPTNVVQLHVAAAALRLNPAGDPRSLHVPTLRFELEHRHLARHHHRKFSGKVTRPPSALPVSHHPGGVSPHIGGDLVLLELPTGVLLGRIAEMSMNHVIDALLLPAVYNDRAHVDLHS